MTDEVPAPPEGFALIASRGAFASHNGPWFQRTDPADPGLVEHAVFVLPRHANSLGVLHGGMLTTFLDGMLGAAASRADGRSAVTVHLSVDFLRMVRRGVWLTGRARLTHAAQDVAFAEGEARVGGRLVGRANGVFKLLGPTRGG